MSKEEALLKFEEMTGISLKDLDPEGQGSIRMNLPVDLLIEQFAAYLLVVSALLEEEEMTLERIKEEVGNMIAASLMLHARFPGQVRDLVNEYIGFSAPLIPSKAEREVAVTLLDSVTSN